MSGYRENAMPLEARREQEYARHAADMERRWDAEDGSWSEGIPHWAQERFIEEKKAKLEAMQKELERSRAEFEREYEEERERLLRKVAAMDALDALDRNADARDDADEDLDLALGVVEEEVAKKRRVAAQDTAAIDRVRVDIEAIEPDDEAEDAAEKKKRVL
jgi:hypothetical protein